MICCSSAGKAELRKRSRWVLAKECPISRFHAILEDFSKPRFSKSVRQAQGKCKGRGKGARCQQSPDEADEALVPLDPPEDEEALDEEQDAAPSEPAEDIPDDDGHESQDGESEPEALDLMLKEIDALPTPVLVEDSPMPGKTLNSPAGCPSTPKGE